MRGLTTAVVLFFAVLVLPSAVFAQRSVRVRVPEDAPTIQDGIDMVSDGGTVMIAPGAYMETVDIVGKQVHLVGGDRLRGWRTLIVDVTPEEVVPVSRARGLINYGPGGGGRIENLTLVGGDAAVLGVADARNLPADVIVENTALVRNGRGITGRFSRLRLVNSSIVQSLWHGLSPCAELLELVGGFITNTNQLGILAIACQGDQSVVIDNAFIAGNLSGGAAFFGNVQVSITDSTLSGNSVFGVLLVETPQQTVISNTALVGTVRGQSPGFGELGDGLIATKTGNISIIGSQFVGNQRAGVMLHEVPTHGFFVNSVISANDYGIVTQAGAAFTELGSGNIITGNTQQNILTDGNLPVPQPPPVPQQ